MIIGTRGSDLALAQANTVSGMLDKQGFETTIEIIKTTGDTFTDRPLHEVSGVGVFVRELDDRMLANEIDIAVHSMKDLATERPPELSLAAVLERDSPSDVLLTTDGSTMEELPDGAIIGTSSMRRRAQVLRFRPDLNVQDLRGNINTRIQKLRDGKYDGILLAEAGLQRMGWEMDVQRLDPEFFCPSANQGTIVVVTKKDTEADKICNVIDHPETRIETEIERIVTSKVEGGCSAPVGSFARMVDDGSGIHIIAEVLSLDGLEHVRVDEVIPLDKYWDHAQRLAQELVDLGGKKLVSDAICKLSGDCAQL